jgi:hypothetical protein
MLREPSIQISFCPSLQTREGLMKIFNIAVIYGDQEFEGYAVLAEDGKRALEVLAGHLSGQRSYQ